MDVHSILRTYLNRMFTRVNKFMYHLPTPGFVNTNPSAIDVAVDVPLTATP